MTIQARSAAHIKIVKPEPTDLIGGLRKMLDGFGPDINLHDRADIVIEACISQGILTRSEIIAVTDRLGFTRGHIPIRLDAGTGTNPNLHRWRLGAAGRYSLFA